MQVRVFIGLDGDRRERVGSCLGVFTDKLELLGATVSWMGVMIPFAHKALPTLFWECCVCLGGRCRNSVTKHWQRASRHVGLGDNAVSQLSKYF